MYVAMEGNRNKSKPRALLVFGAPCSGKTTFAEKFAEKFGLTYYDLTTFESEYGFGPDDLFAVLELILRTRQSIVIEGCIDSEKDRTELRNFLRSHGYDPALIWVQTDINTIRLRLKMRHKSVSKAKKVYEDAVVLLEAPTDIEKPIILSGKHTFDTQVKHVVKGLAELTEK